MPSPPAAYLASDRRSDTSSLPGPIPSADLSEELFDWYDLDSFQSQSVERLQIPDFFSPQLVHCSTEYAGIDVAVSRTRLRAEAQGVVPQADRILGSRFEVLPRSSPIILPLKRAGPRARLGGGLLPEQPRNNCESLATCGCKRVRSASHNVVGSLSAARAAPLQFGSRSAR